MNASKSCFYNVFFKKYLEIFSRDIINKTNKSLNDKKKATLKKCGLFFVIT